MALTLSIPVTQDLSPRITVIGVGGAGGNAVNNMIEKELEGCEFVVANTDAQALQQSRATNKLQLGARVTEGLGAGARPEVGAAAAEESIEDIVEKLSGCHMCFITGGMGGGTGTGAAPIIAKAAREMGVLTVGVVTKPFQFEGSRRMRQAENGVDELQKHVDTLIIIPNQNLFRLANEKTTFTDAFALADDVLYQGVKGVTDLMVRPGIINLDFADVRSVMNEMGKAMMGTGEAEGEDRAVQAAEKAIANPLLDEISLKGAKGVLINITAGPDLTLFELDEAANRIRAEVDPEANIMVGSTLDPEMAGQMRVSVVATGIDALARSENVPVPQRKVAEPIAAPAAAAPKPAPQPAPEPLAQPEVARAPSFADTQSVEFERESFEAEPEYAAAPQPVPQPAEMQRTAPYGQPKIGAAGQDRRPGEPSPDALRRLQAAVQNVPKAQPMVRPLASSPREAERNSRLTINSLIHKMTGQAGREAPAARQRPAEPGFAAHEPHAHEQDYEDTERERVDIPAFLRRQAN
ncbi:MAG TPA: cell division protein FtsZ [Amaricoccus sp.]|uniref:cell division protein FtsZ n=1 Tax=Amaricoccus sp. TaxID=1872485 RepID=UPI001DF77054|nr:cell division protein FtsZ [Amaricoccus sp.]MCC0067637.1 cell division protein FtsZ [Rhodovulum sp.]HPG21628.1 cell division protein FtsZ [Amaricoccus sp.]HRW15882.1 cell division protein FtsZ [Amaricoccus sp.]